MREGSPVARVVIREARAHGVELEDGTVIGAKRVISSAHPITTYLDLIGEQNLSPEVVHNIRRYRTRSGSVKVTVEI